MIALKSVALFFNDNANADQVEEQVNINVSEYAVGGRVGLKGGSKKTALGDYEEEDLSYLIFQPFNPENRPNMQSFLVADADPENYGQLIDYRLPKGEFVDGPSQVSTRINQDPDISQIFTLLDQQGSSVIRGNLFVVPINQSVLYYQPIYLQGEQNPLPEFKFVVVIFQDKIIMEESLGEALQGIFDGTTFSDVVDKDNQSGLGAIELLEKANIAFNEAQDELISGDLGRYQELIELAEEYVALAIEELNK